MFLLESQITKNIDSIHFVRVMADIELSRTYFMLKISRRQKTSGYKASRTMTTSGGMKTVPGCMKCVQSITAIMKRNLHAVQNQ